jgi:hypothetical protein
MQQQYLNLLVLCPQARGDGDGDGDGDGGDGGASATTVTTRTACTACTACRSVAISVQLGGIAAQPSDQHKTHCP